MKMLFPHPIIDLAVEDVYRDLQFPEPPTDRPYLILNFVTTLDGQATLSDGGVAGIGSKTDHRLMRRLRILADCLLSGAGTVRKHNFRPIVPADLEAERIARGLTPQPLAAVVSASGDLSLENNFFAQGHPLIFTTTSGAARLGPAASDRARVLSLGETRVDLLQALWVLRYEHHVRVVLSEGGPRLVHDLLSQGCVDELFLTLAPKIGSDRDALRLVEGPAFPLGALPQADLLHILIEGSELFLRYRISPAAST